jgi:hypothetical protein
LSKQSSPALSSIAGRYARLSVIEIVELADSSREALIAIATDLKRLAGSVLSQDETKGQAAKGEQHG